MNIVRLKNMIPLFLIATLFVSCHNFLQVVEPQDSDAGTMVNITFAVSNNNERTALPSGLDLNNYDYIISKKTASTEAGLDSAVFENIGGKKTLTEIGNTVSVSQGWYVFKLTAYAKNQDNFSVLEGTTAKMNLTTGSHKFSFCLKPVAGADHKGNAEVTLKVPVTVKRVEYAWVDGNIASAIAKLGDTTQLTSVLTDEASGWTQGTMLLEKTFSKTELLAGGEHFIVFRMYEALEGDPAGVYNNFVAARMESLYIVHGLTSKSTIIVEDNVLHSYATTIKLFTAPSDQTMQPWGGSNKEIVLVNKYDPADTYVLQDAYGNGTFVKTAVVDGDYEVYIREEGTAGNGVNTGKIYNPKEANNTTEVYSIKFVDVTLPSNGVDLVPSTPMPAAVPGSSGQILYVENSTSPIEFTVQIKPGYEIDPDVGAITLNNNPLPDAKPGTPGININLTPSQLEDIEHGRSVFGGVKLIVYTITYTIDSATEHWVEGYTAPSTYTVAAYPSFPTDAQGRPVTYITKDQSGTTTYEFDGWQTTISGNVQRFTQIPSGTIGNLTLVPLWKTGVVITPSDPDPDIEGTIFASGYSLIVKWGTGTSSNETWVFYDKNSNGTIDAADDTQISYTVGGVTKYDFTDFKLVAKNSDDSASASDFTFTILGGKLACLEGLGYDANSTSTVNISGNDTKIGNGTSTGVLLYSLKNEKVYVDGQLSGDYQITLVTRNSFKLGSSTNDVAIIGNSAWAQLSKFKCLLKDTFKELDLTITNNGTSSVISLANDKPIVGPDPDDPNNGIIWDPKGIGAVTTEFSLGDAALISVPCSVFSVYVQNGSFQLTQADMKTEAGTALPSKKLAISGSQSYKDGNINTSNYYEYIHFFSTNNQITPERATEFLKTIVFKKSESTDISIFVNIETVPFEDILEFGKAETGASATDDQILQKFNYYNGSFYFYKTENNAIYWPDAYNSAKSMIFNGMNGYLATITSNIEHTYLYGQLTPKDAWIGGSRLKPVNDSFDQKTFSYSSSSPYYTESDKLGYYWECGPEAGIRFWGSTSSSGGNIPGVHNQFGAGNPSTTADCVAYFANGTAWQAYKYNEGKKAKQYVVEFRPYKNLSTGTEQKANYQAIVWNESYHSPTSP